MTPGLQRTTFNRSGLVRLLSEITPEPVDPKYDFGERLGQWLDFADALALFSALNADAARTAAPASDANASPLAAQLNRVRDNLGNSIQNDGVFSEGTARIRFPTPLPQATAKEAADFAPYHRYYLAHQRDMASAISALRSNARKALAARSPALRQLAELDANFDKILIVRATCSAISRFCSPGASPSATRSTRPPCRPMPMTIRRFGPPRGAGLKPFARTPKPCCWPNSICA